MTKISNYVRPGAAGVVFPGTPGSTGGTLGSLTDGVTTVSPVLAVDFTAGATVSDLGSGIAGVAVTGTFSNPMTTEGDLIYEHSGVPARLAVGTSGQVLSSNGTDPLWATPAVWAPLMVADVDGTHWNVVVDGGGNAIVVSE